MPYWLTRATTPTGSTIWFPRFNPVDPLDTGGFVSKTLPLSGGGVWDEYQNEPLPRGIRTLSRKGMLRESSKAAIEAAYNALAVGAGGKVAAWRQSETGNRADWCGGRMMIDAGDRDPVQLVRRDDGYYTLDVTITLELQDTVWHGIRHGTALAPLDATPAIGLDATVPLDDSADTTTLSSSPQTVTVTNDGDANVDDGVLSVLAAGADLTAFGWTCGKTKCAWTGTVKSANTLIVDSGNGIVANQTALTAPAVAGATALTVANAAGTGWATGGRIRIVLDDGTIFESTIASLGGTTTVNISPGLPGAAASGRVIWAAAYSGFSRDATLHSIAPWVRFVPSSNSLICTHTGGSPVLTRSFYDAWA